MTKCEQWGKLLFGSHRENLLVRGAPEDLTERRFAQDTTQTAYLFSLNTSLEGGTDFTAEDETDATTVTIDGASVTKTVDATSESSTSDDDVAIGEVVTYQVVITVPEGKSTDATLVDTLDTGLAFVEVTSITASSGVSTDVSGGFEGTDSVLDTATIENKSTGTENDGTKLTLDFGTITNSNTANATADTITVTYKAVVLNTTSTNKGDDLDNDADWTATNDSASDSAAEVNIVEPELDISTSLSSTTGDAGDTITVTVVAQNNGSGDTAASAFDLSLSDAIPTGMTFAGNLQDVAGEATTSLSESSGTVTATWSAIAPSESSTISFEVTLDGDVAPTQEIENSASATWTSLPAASTDTNIAGTNNSFDDERDGAGTAPDDYTGSDSDTLTIDAITTTLSLETSETATTGDDVAPGEIVRVRMTVKIPEGEAGNFKVQAHLPDGVQFLEDADTAELAFVSSGGDSLDSSNTNLNSAAVSGDESTVAGIDPSHTIPAAAISADGGGSFASGTDPIFDLSTLTNDDDDSNDEFAVIEFNAIVLNEAGNQADDALTVDYTVMYDGGPDVDPTDETLTVVEPEITDVNKELTDTDGTTVSYQITFSNTGTATAHDIDVLDNLAANIGSLTNVSITGDGTGTTNNSDADTLDVSIGELAASGSVTITFDATVTDNTAVVSSSDATLTYTSLDGTGTSLDGSSQGTAGDSDGERTGSGSGANDYSDTDGAGLGVVSGTLWEDLIDNNTQDAGEDLLSSVSVTITWGGPDDTVGSGGDDVELTTTTDGSGDYSFGALPAGNYEIKTATTVATEYTPTYDIEGDQDDAEATFSLGEAEDKSTVDFGYLGINDAPAFANLDATPAFNENDSPMVLDANATISDEELDIFADYDAAVLTLVRNGGADSDDQFGFRIVDFTTFPCSRG